MNSYWAKHLFHHIILTSTPADKASAWSVHLMTRQMPTKRVLFTVRQHSVKLQSPRDHTSLSEIHISAMSKKWTSQDDIRTKSCCSCIIYLQGRHTHSCKETAFWNVTSYLIETPGIFGGTCYNHLPSRKENVHNFYLLPIQKILAFSHHHKSLKFHTVSSSLTAITICEFCTKWNVTVIVNYSMEGVLKEEVVAYLRAYSSILIGNTYGRLRWKGIKILFVKLHTKAAICKNPGVKETQPCTIRLQVWVK